MSENLSPQKIGFLDSLDKKADYIKSEFEKSGAQISEQTFTVDGKVYRNVIADFGANDKEKIIVGAHYDTAKDFSGADDNSSGIAGLIELSRLLSQTELPLQIELVAYALEEPPYFATQQMGSFIHADSLKKQNANVRLMICLEMIGYFTDENDSQNYPVSLLKLFYPSKGNFIVVVGSFGNGLTTRRLKASMISGVDLPIYSINAPDFVNGVDFSDHRNYWKLGYNAVMITDTAFYRNKNYHSNNDTSEKLDYPRMAKTIEATFAAIIEISK
ncbi:MAG: M28 family peptidase [Pyrinomonadaceae bacterium]|nr:M28 family peptidase [Pyrinomonadaceae bacterium]